MITEKCLLLLPKVAWGAQSPQLRAAAHTYCCRHPHFGELCGFRGTPQPGGGRMRSQPHAEWRSCFVYIGPPFPGPLLWPPAAWPPAQHSGETDSAGGRHACVGEPIHSCTDTPTSPVQLASKLYLLFSESECNIFVHAKVILF